MADPGPVKPRLESALSFREAGSGVPQRALAGAEVLASSRGLAWPGVLVEAGRNDSWETNDLVVDGHYLVVNLADAPLCFEQRDGGDWQPVVMPPDSLWINPDGRPFSHRIAEPCHYGALTLDP